MTTFAVWLQHAEPMLAAVTALVVIVTPRLHKTFDRLKVQLLY